jgi:hypothetical protein
MDSSLNKMESSVLLVGMRGVVSTLQSRPTAAAPVWADFSSNSRLVLLLRPSCIERYTENPPSG